MLHHNREPKIESNVRREKWASILRNDAKKQNTKKTKKIIYQWAQQQPKTHEAMSKSFLTTMTLP